MFILCIFHVFDPGHYLDYHFLKGKDRVNPHAAVQTQFNTLHIMNA